MAVKKKAVKKKAVKKKAATKKAPGKKGGTTHHKPRRESPLKRSAPRGGSQN
jgi:hypothetical protein